MEGVAREKSFICLKRGNITHCPSRGTIVVYIKLLDRHNGKLRSLAAETEMSTRKRISAGGRMI